jgi:hypothetical protein
VHDGDRLLFQQRESDEEPSPPVVALDLATLGQQPLFVPPDQVQALFVTSTTLFIGTTDGVYRTDKDGEGLEQLHATDLSIMTIAGDEEMVFWVVAGGQLFAWDPVVEVVEEVPIQAGYGNGYAAVDRIAVSEDAVYLLRTGYVDMTTEHSGSVWRLWRP